MLVVNGLVVNDPQANEPETCEMMQSLPLPQEELALLKQATAEAGRIALHYFKKDPDVWYKEGNSPVTEADFAVDNYLRKTLLSARPDYGWISEETADERDVVPRQRFFVVDPIDGTRSFIRGDDQWCVSVAIIENGRPLAGVLECSVRGEVLEAHCDGIAMQNNEPIRVAGQDEDEPLSIALSRSAFDTLPANLRDRVQMHPYVSSLAYRIGMVARGDIAGTFVRPNSNDWDLAAADLILSRAGGRLVDVAGAPLHYGGASSGQGALVASSGKLLEEMLSVVAA
ncbi:myo-inositol-1(or 4)-monophosphatase [Paenochrobactrum gallinarii]|uniref:Myo-inositol-1(Or 4)-monophosphatase n=2 Tax=Paenochrobactrum gallinarii TaxID=643673 RepID=A0A841LQS3_9HYPH|nr:myo-inositol-1(or 4)-monophosphatase [Paenochrobactrum gallinarii]